MSAASLRAASSEIAGPSPAAAVATTLVPWVVAAVCVGLGIALASVCRRKLHRLTQRENRLVFENQQFGATVEALQHQLAQTREGLRKSYEAQLASLQKELVVVSRQAGTAEVATSVLHNVGNVLNSVNVSATLVADRVRASKVAFVPKVSDLLQEHGANLASFLTDDPKGQKIPAYLSSLGQQLVTEQNQIVEELGHLRKNIEHIKEIVALQQSVAKVSGIAETVMLSEIIEDAVRMNAGALERHQVELVREYDAPISITIERHKVIQILINLIRNAKYACDDSERSDKRIVLRTTKVDGRVRIAIIDNGVGIPPENLTRIFAHGFTTRKDGHGFGLHSGAIAAKDLGGFLTAQSDGVGKGATFILDLPLRTEATIEARAAKPEPSLAFA